MELIKEISRNDFDLSFVPNPDQRYKIRKAARAIVRRDNRIAILNVTRQGIHKIPGGGIEKGEDIREGLSREVLEETGYKIEVESDLGLVIEYRDEFEQIQISYIFIARVVGEPDEVSFTKDELEDGFKLEWIELDKVLSIIEQDCPKDYRDNKYINLRDKEIVKYYLEKFSIKN
jgi:8-oxo-dGTP diphosphatase